MSIPPLDRVARLSQIVQLVMATVAANIIAMPPPDLLSFSQIDEFVMVVVVPPSANAEMPPPEFVATLSRIVLLLIVRVAVGPDASAADQR